MGDVLSNNDNSMAVLSHDLPASSSMREPVDRESAVLGLGSWILDLGTAISSVALLGNDTAAE